ncbi:MAG TPA: (2Fe-2S)-binding protein [Thermoanaerobaculia bacterium]|nr:(2Fe-2S)-binding protein [Thermoanaerobaculia bacterium]
MRVLRLSLKKRNKETTSVIICICRGKSERDINRAIDNGAESVRDLQLCGIGDQCGSCHNSLRAMLAQSAAASAQPCAACVAPGAISASATA